MKTLRVKLKTEIDESYDILIETSILDDLSDLIRKEYSGKYAIITDSNVSLIYGEELLTELKERKIDSCLLDFPAGEGSKSMNTVIYLTSKLLENRLDRKSTIIALGGGVPGDVGGFTASVFMRGVHYIQVPTSLLAQVDSSVGGKTAVNTLEGKNILGSFYQPRAVYIDPLTLKTLPEREFRSGLAEVVKYGILNRDFFEFLEENVKRIRRLNQEVLKRTIWSSCKIKKEIIEEDPREENRRSILNYGHTIGHVIESLSDFKMNHGEAIAVGMNIAGRIAVEKGLWIEEELERQNRMIKSLGLPLQIKLDEKELFNTIYHDKKSEVGRIMFVLPERIGKMAKIQENYRIPVSEEEILSVLSQL